MKIICFLIVISSYNVFAQWQPDFRLTNHPDSSLTSPNNARGIAALGSTVHVTWYDNRDGNYEIYYKRSTDDGVTWSADIRLTNDIAFSQRPSVAVSGSYIHVTWYDFRNSNEEIYYKRSTDGGVTWGADTRLTNNFNVSILPSISASGSFVNIVWCDTRDGNYEVYYKRSTDDGATWGADTRLTNNASLSLQASCVMRGTTVHVTWNDTRHGNDEIYYKRSTDNGSSWGADTRLTSNSGVSWFPSIAASGLLAAVSWVELSDGNPEIYLKRSTDDGQTWGSDERMTNNAGISIRPTVSINGSVIHLVWEDNIDGNEELYYKNSTDGGVTYSANIRLTNNPALSVYPSHTISASAIHVIWREFRDGNWEVYYKRNPTGNLVGLQNMNSGIPENFFLGQNYPNPFNPKTNFGFRIAHSGFVSVKVYDISGKEVAVLVNGNLSAGIYNIDFEASPLASGVYFYRLDSDDFSDIKKMVLVK